MEIEPRAIASRRVTALVPTSTILTRPRRSTWESLGARDEPLGFIALPLGKEEREALEGHGQVHALQLHVGRRLQCAGRKIQHRLDAGRDDEVDHVLGGRRRHGDDRDADAVTADDLLEVLDLMNRYAAARPLPDL